MERTRFIFEQNDKTDIEWRQQQYYQEEMRVRLAFESQWKIKEHRNEMLTKSRKSLADCRLLKACTNAHMRFLADCHRQNRGDIILPGKPSVPSGVTQDAQIKLREMKIKFDAHTLDDHEINAFLLQWRKASFLDELNRHSYLRKKMKESPKYVIVVYGAAHFRSGSQAIGSGTSNPLEEYMDEFNAYVVEQVSWQLYTERFRKYLDCTLDVHTATVEDVKSYLAVVTPEQLV